jgi:hypothetical protein
MMLEVLNGAFVFLGLSTGAESAQVSTLARARVELPRVQTIAARPKFPNHGFSLSL